MTHTTAPICGLPRRAVLSLGAASAAALAAGRSQAATSNNLGIQRLAWAGIKLQLPTGSLFIDPLISAEVWGPALKDRLMPLYDEGDQEDGARYVLATHTHGDHADPAAIREALGETGTLIYPENAAPPHVPGVRMRAARLYEPLLLGDFTATPVPAADGYGDPQVSWVVFAGGKRIIHCGDTAWHGSWWRIGRQLGPFDAAFLPINGARFSFREPASEIPAVLTPEQAVAAAVVLKAKQLVPIHYGIEGAQNYAEVEHPLDLLREAAARRNVRLNSLAPGEWIEWN